MMLPFRLRHVLRANLLALAALAFTLPAAAQGQVYVVSGSTVAAIDPATHTVQAVIPVGASPARVVASPDRTRAYVTNAGSNSVSVIDTGLNAVVATFAVGVAPSGVAVSPDGTTLYVSTDGGVIQTVDTGTGLVTGAIATAGGAGGDVAVSADGARVYVASGPVTVIDAASRAVVASFASGASGIEVSPDGTRAYVTYMATLFGGGLQVIDLTAGFAVLATLNLGVPGPMALAADGSRLYISHSATFVDTGYGAGFFPGRSVFVFDPLTNTVVAQIDLGASGSNWSQQHTPGALAVTPDKRRVYISVPRLAAVAAADVNTHQVTATTPIASPGSVTVIGDGAAVVPFVINAVDDTATYADLGGVAIASVLANDSLGGVRPTLQHVTLALVAASQGLTLDEASGAVTVAAGAPLGDATVVYEICERATPGNCDRATATVTVRENYAIDAVDDAATTLPGRYALASVLANDLFHGAPATLTDVVVSQVATGASTIALVPSTAGVFVSVGTPAGVHTLTYRICERATPGNCDEATVTLTVDGFAIDAVDDAGAVTRTGGTAVASVLANDRFNGAAATVTRVALSVVTAATGVTLNTATGAVTVSPATPTGVYTVRYRICEIATPANCDTAAVTITVRPYLVSAVNDYGRGSSKVANTPIASVLANDTIGGVRATASNSVLSLVSLTPANSKIRLDTADGSVDVLGKTSSSVFALRYRLCEAADPANCAEAVATIELSGK